LHLTIRWWNHKFWRSLQKPNHLKVQNNFKTGILEPENIFQVFRPC
jgi:hypothetical protein